MRKRMAGDRSWRARWACIWILGVGVIVSCNFDLPYKSLRSCSSPSASIYIEKLPGAQNRYQMMLKDTAGAIEAVIWNVNNKTDMLKADQPLVVELSNAGDFPVTAILTNLCEDSVRITSKIDVFPVVSGISPNRAGYGDIVTISGSNFTSNVQNVAIEVNSMPVREIVSSSASQIRFAVPKGAGSGAIKLTVNNRAVTAGQAFTYVMQPGVEILNEITLSPVSLFDICYGYDDFIYYCGHDLTKSQYIIGRYNPSAKTNEVLWTGTMGFANGDKSSAKFNTPARIVSSNDAIYVLENEKTTNSYCSFYSSYVRKIDKNLNVTTLFKNETNNPCYLQDLSYDAVNDAIVVFDGSYFSYSLKNQKLTKTTNYTNDSRLLTFDKTSNYNLVFQRINSTQVNWVLERRPFSSLHSGTVLSSDVLEDKEVMNLSIAHSAFDNSVYLLDKSKMYKINAVNGTKEVYYTAPSAGSRAEGPLKSHIFNSPVSIAVNGKNGDLFILDGSWFIKKVSME